MRGYSKRCRHSTLGRTRLKFAKKLHGKTRIINFSYGKIPPRIKEIITGLGMVVMDNAGLSLHRYEVDKVRNHYMCWARGSRLPLR
jgi:predicted solute-binding protein